MVDYTHIIYSLILQLIILDFLTVFQYFFRPHVRYKEIFIPLCFYVPNLNALFVVETRLTHKISNNYSILN
jgi:hypothetical protein